MLNICGEVFLDNFPHVRSFMRMAIWFEYLTMQFDVLIHLGERRDDAS
jgi:hypothetical protein